MRLAIRYLVAMVFLGLSAAPSLAQTKESNKAIVAATVETTLSTAPGQIRQFAFDGDPTSYYASQQNPASKDHFTLVFDEPVAVKSIAVTTGRPNGSDALDEGAVEISSNGKTFEPLAKFARGEVRVQADGRKVCAVRIQPGAELKHPLVIREIVIDSEPKLAIFQYPVEFAVDTSDAPEMKEWADSVARLCERWYPKIVEELNSDGFKPRRQVQMTLKNNYKGVAAAGGGRIVGSVKFFKQHPEDKGAMIHETVHIVQNYRTWNNPSWLVEGIADYIRFFKYEPGKIGPINVKRAKYNGSYRVSAAFLNYVAEKYDKELVRKLNKLMREGEYKETAFKALTGKTVQELDEEWRATLESKADVVAFVGGGSRNWREFLDELEAEENLQPSKASGPPLLKTYKVANAEVIAKQLQDANKDNKNLKIAAVSADTIMVYGSPEDHFRLALDPCNPGHSPGIVIQTILLKKLNAAIAAETLKKTFGDPKNESPFIEANPKQNTLIVRGTQEQVREIRAALGELGETAFIQKLGSAEKKFSVSFKNVPWTKVFEWLADISGLPIAATTIPTGTFTFNPPSPDKTYSLGEVIDILNEALLAKSFILVRGNQSFHVLASDHKIDPLLIPLVSRESLGKRGETEFVAVLVSLRGIAADDIAPEIKKLTGPFGEVIVLTSANKLLLRDMAGNLSVMLKVIDDSEGAGLGSQAATLTYKCRFINAKRAEAMLRKLLTPDPQAGSSKTAKEQKILLTFAVDEQTNTIFVSGRENMIVRAKECLEKLDVSGQAGPPLLRRYQVADGKAEVLARLLQQMYKDSPKIRIADVAPRSILVYAGPEEQIQIAEYLQQSITLFDVLPLTSLDAVKTADTLRAMFGDPKAGGPVIEADPQRNALILRGSSDQLREIRDALRQLGEGVNQPRNVRVFTLERGDAATLAEALQHLLKQTRPNPVKVITPTQTLSEPSKATPKKEEPGKKDAKPSKVGAPITLLAINNKLIVTTEDPQAMAAVAEMIQHLQAPAGEGDFEVIRLKHAKATDLMTVLDEAFNGPPRQAGGGGGGFKGAPAAGPRPARVRIVADAATNSLLVKGTPLDVLTVRQLVTRHLDIPGAGEAEAPRPAGEGDFEVLRLKHARAEAVAKILNEAFNGPPAGGKGLGAGPRPQDRVRIIADPVTNSLLVKAAPHDMRTIRMLVTTALDIPGAGDAGGPAAGKKDSKKE